MGEFKDILYKLFQFTNDFNTKLPLSLLIPLTLYFDDVDKNPEPEIFLLKIR
jgi:hypothetical protein